MDPLLSYSISKFRLMYIPEYLLKRLPPFLSSLIISLVPVTPVNLIIFVSVFVFLYITGIYTMGTYYSCKNNKVTSKRQFSLWTTLKSTYYFYFLTAYVFNLLTLTDYQFVNLNAVIARQSMA